MHTDTTTYKTELSKIIVGFEDVTILFSASRFALGMGTSPTNTLRARSSGSYNRHSTCANTYDEYKQTVLEIKSNVHICMLEPLANCNSAHDRSALSVRLVRTIVVVNQLNSRIRQALNFGPI